MEVDMPNAHVLAAGKASVVEYDWGSLHWYAGRGLGNAAELTVGECRILPGQENPAHSHPNCEEVLHLITGHIRHTAGDEVYTLHPGDTITIPRGVRHSARNIGDEIAVMSIAYSSADRQMQPE
jgi:quercetin dioxygenase-like cupin family protein